MVHKSSLIPGFSKFIDENILSQYSPNSAKRMVMAVATSLYLKRGESIVDTLISHPLIAPLGVVQNGGMIELEPIRDAFKYQVEQMGFVRMSFPVIGDIDFTKDDIDAIYRCILETNSQPVKASVPPQQTTPISAATITGGVY